MKRERLGAKKGVVWLELAPRKTGNGDTPGEARRHAACVGWWAGASPSSFLRSPPLTFPSSLCQAPQFLVPSSLSPPKRTGSLPLARTLKGGSRGEGGLSLAYPSFLFPPLSALLHCTARKGGRGRKADPGWESSPLPPSLATCMQLFSLSALPQGSRYCAKNKKGKPPTLCSLSFSAYHVAPLF